MLCTHPVKLKATDITAYIATAKGGTRHLAGGFGDDSDAPVLAYAEVIYCAAPTCERVFSSVLASERSAERR